MSLSIPNDRSRRALALVVTALGALWSCAPARGGDPAPAAAEVASTRAAAGACEWDPSFSTQYCFEGDWWTEFSVRDPTVETLEVEVSNPPATVPLPFRTGLAEGYTKFAGGPGRQLPAGTLVRLRATQDAASGGHATTSDWFAYQTGDPRAYCPGGPCTPSCAPGSCGSNGCGGTCACAPGMTCQGGQCVAPGGCVAPWNPKWEQGPSAGEWYAEWRIFGGSLPVSVTLEVPGGGSVPLENGFGWWTGGPGGLPTGTTVYLRATDVTGATARTLPFHYLMDTAPVTDPCAGTPGTSPDCAPLKRGMVSFTMDDSLPSQDELARPLLATYGMKATIYHITNQLSSFGVLPYAQSLAAAGHEVGSHSRTHPDLASVSPAQLQDELGTSKQYLLSHVGAPAESFATPMGSYNAAVVAAIKGHYLSHRTVNPGLNYMGNDLYELNADGVYNDSTVAEVCAQLAEAASVKGWRILVFHEFITAPTSNQSLSYPISWFAGILQCAQSMPGLDVVTVREGSERLRCASPP